MNSEIKKNLEKALNLNKNAFLLELQNFFEDFIKRHKYDNDGILKYHYIYEIKFLSYVYVGKHSTNDLDDGYIGSGNFVLRFQEFKHLYEKKILVFCNETNVFEKEQEYIRKYKKQFGNNCVNIITKNDSDKVNEIIEKLYDALHPYNDNKIDNDNEIDMDAILSDL